MRTQSLHAGLVLALAAAIVGVGWLWSVTLPVVGTFGGLDLFHFFLPVHAAVERMLGQGQFPLWNENLGLGTSWVAEIQAGIFYPPNLLYALLPPALAMDWLAATHVVLAASGAAMLCRATGLGWGSIAIVAVGIGTGQALRHLTSWPSMLASFAWCPTVLWLSWRVGRSSGTRVTPLGIALAMQVFAGYLQFHLYTVPCAVLFALCGTAGATRSTTRVVLRLGAAELLALGLAAVAIAPALAAVRESHDPRKQSPMRL
jgi:hypothetical protein